MEEYKFKGYHGTSINAARNILSMNYKSSIGNKEWLGDGIYFFIFGINNKLEELAENWSKAQAWDKKNKRFKYSYYCNLKSTITVKPDYFLDLTTEDGIEILEYLITKFEDKIKEIGRKLHFIDGMMINLARGEGLLEIDVAKGNFYIKFAYERINNIQRRTPNCTICSVFNLECISETVITKIGKVRNETI